MLSNTVSQYHESMTNRAINTAFEYKGKHDLCVAVVETNSDFIGYFNNPNVAFIKPNKGFDKDEFVKIAHEFMTNNQEEFEDYNPDHVLIIDNNKEFYKNWVEDYIVNNKVIY